MAERARTRRALRVTVQGFLVAMAAAVAFGGMAAVGPSPVAKADPPAADADPGKDKQSLLNRIKARIHEEASQLNSADPDYRKKLLARLAGDALLSDFRSGALGVSPSDARQVIEGAFKYYLRSKQTVDGLQSRMTKMDEYIRQLEKKALEAKGDKQKKAIEKLEKAKKNREKLKKLYKDAVRQTRPFDWDKEVTHLENRVKELEKRVNGKHRSDAAKNKVATELAKARADLEKARADRDRYQRPDDEGGTPVPRKGPTDPPKNPPTGARRTVPVTGTPKTGAGKPGRIFSGPRNWLPRNGGRSGGGAELAAVIGDLLEQARAEHASEEHQKLLKKALHDPKLRQRIVDEYLDLRDNSPIDDLKRPFDDTKKFTPGELDEIGPALLDYHTKELARKSNADPVYRKAYADCGGYETCVRERVKKLRKDIADAERRAGKSASDPVYQQARRDCGGYETCVKERVKKLRKDIADAERRAGKSASDPVYQQARRDCGGYETCVKERVKKLRKNIADADRKAKKSAGDPLYRQAMRECGGYDTCVQDRLKKLRAAKPATAKQVAAKPVTSGPKNTDAGKKTAAAKARKQYEEASRICGGYDTCVKDRLKKVRAAETKPKKEAVKRR
ncbi:hypothetical protein [Amycolatopsis sp. NPDC059021]|uniref:hypothetical protein n=1 Tax=Amycolatopsis sp. NPDC059021 TaxID=3346704 RepID=UPI00366D06F0